MNNVFKFIVNKRYFIYTVIILLLILLLIKEYTSHDNLLTHEEKKKQNSTIRENIISITSKNKVQLSVVKTIALPHSAKGNLINSTKTITNVSYLFKKIIETLDENGEELLADNILLKCNKIGIISKKVISKQRDSNANKVINKYTWITGELKNL